MAPVKPGDWVDNPMSAPQVDIEMTQTHKKESVLEDMARSVWESKLKIRDMKIKALEEEIKQLKATIDTLKHLNKSKQGKSRNSWKRSQSSKT